MEVTPELENDSGVCMCPVDNLYSWLQYYEPHFEQSDINDVSEQQIFEYYNTISLH